MKRICFLPVVLLLTGLLCGCTGQQQNDPSPQEHNHAMEEGTETPKYDHLTVYSPLPESETLLYCSAFRKDTGITVDCIHLPAGEMTARLEQERDNPQASVLLGGSADNYIQLREAGLLEAYQSPELTDVPEAYQDEQGVWNPIYIGTLCFACNTDWFARTGTPMPTCWDDLLSPALAGQIVMATPKSSGTSYTTLATLVQMRGEDKAWEYLKKLDQNVGAYYTASSTELVKQVSTGDLVHIMRRITGQHITDAADYAVNAQIEHLEAQNILNEHEILGQLYVLAVKVEHLVAHRLGGFDRVNSLDMHKHNILVHLRLFDGHRRFFVQIERVKVTQHLRAVAPALHLQVAAHAVRADDLAGL